jgi:hypothetical protein
VVRNLHLGENGGAVVRYGDIAIGGDEDLVESAGALPESVPVSIFPSPESYIAYKRCLNEVGDCLCGQNVRLDGLVAMLPLLLALAVCCQLLPTPALLQSRATYSLTIMNGRPVSSFITWAVVPLR